MGPVARILFNPYVTGALFTLISCGIPVVDDVLLRILSPQNIQNILTAFKFFFVLGLISRVNSKLNAWADNKWLKSNEKTVWNWPSEVAVITGGSNGIGALVAKKLAGLHVQVAVLDVQPLGEDMKSVPNITHFQCDIRSRDAVASVGEAIRTKLGEPSVLINNAGIGHAHDILEATPEALRAMFDINIISHWFTIQEFLPDMIIKKKGHVMSVASMASFASPAGMVDYACAKVGLLALHEGLNQELKHRYHCPSIKTSIVHPNWTKTRLIEPIEEDLKKSHAPIMEADFVAERMVQQILSGRSGQLLLPECFRRAPAVRMMPTWLQEIIRDRTSGLVRAKGTSLGV